MKKSRILQLINITLFGLVVLVIWIASVSLSNIDTMKTDLKSNTEQAWRSQSRRELSALKEMLIDDINKGVVNPNNNESLQEWCRVNLASVRNGGPTSDGFMIELATGQFLWDGSPDCARPEFIKNGRFISDEAPLHRNPELANKMLDKMKQGVDTQYGDDYYWEFDDSPELLEWIVIPKTGTGFNNEPSTIGGVNNDKYRAVLIQLGTQTDEILKPYEDIFNSYDSLKVKIYTTSGIALTIVIISMFVIMFMYRGDGGDES